MALYTRGGDSGQTGLGDGSRTSKASARVEAYGTLDELGAVLGFARQAIDDERIDATVRFAQQRLFNCASALANPVSHYPLTARCFSLMTRSAILEKLYWDIFALHSLAVYLDANSLRRERILQGLSDALADGRSSLKCDS